jgi:hypothetical protein
MSNFELEQFMPFERLNELNSITEAFKVLESSNSKNFSKKIGADFSNGPEEAEEQFFTGKSLQAKVSSGY